MRVSELVGPVYQIAPVSPSYNKRFLSTPGIPFEEDNQTFKVNMPHRVDMR